MSRKGLFFMLKIKGGKENGETGAKREGTLGVIVQAKAEYQSIGKVKSLKRPCRRYGTLP